MFGAIVMGKLGPYCRAVWDTVLCWPATKAGSVVRLNCPQLRGLVTERSTAISTAGSTEGRTVDNTVGSAAMSTAGSTEVRTVDNTAGSAAMSTAGSTEGRTVDNTVGSAAMSTAGSTERRTVDNTVGSAAMSTTGSTEVRTVDNTVGSAAMSTAGSTEVRTVDNTVGSTAMSTAGSTEVRTVDNTVGSAAMSTTGSTEVRTVDNTAWSTAMSTAGSTEVRTVDNTVGSAAMSTAGSTEVRTVDNTVGSAAMSTAGSTEGRTVDNTVGSAAMSTAGSTEVRTEDNKAYKVCGPNGLWETKVKGVYTNETGYSHYEDCYSKEAWEYYVKYLGNKTQEEKELIKDIITTSRTLEIVGLCISLVTTIISLGIFWYFSTLKCHRTRIHKNLFVAMIVQISMRIVLYVDQLVAREIGGKIAGAASGDSNTIYDTPIFCEILYSLLEYTKTVKFMWMFIEGIYLHNMIAVSVFSGKPNYVVFYTIGWGFPVLLTIAWVIPMARTHETRCWFAYYMNPLIWIIEGPRVAVMAVNLFFLLNIIRVLVMKLRESQTNEADKLRHGVEIQRKDITGSGDPGNGHHREWRSREWTSQGVEIQGMDITGGGDQGYGHHREWRSREWTSQGVEIQGMDITGSGDPGNGHHRGKAVKAAIVLLPLLGLTNFVIMLEPDGKDPIKFSVWSISTSFLTASEGFFISLLYCFLNGEVQNALRRLIVRHTAYYATDISAAAWRNNTTKVRQTFNRQCYRWRQHRLIHSSSLRRMSRSLSIFTSFTEVPHSSTSQKSQPTFNMSNGEVSESEATHSRFSVIFKARTSRRQSSRDMGSVLGPKSLTDEPDLPDIGTCRTDLMCEEKV
ncbi:hypothetical protein Btru_016506 [Bulinus truncatus]|nr:hypothetical protein Btru_016506 [Bulinus truncatus]